MQGRPSGGFAVGAEPSLVAATASAFGRRASLGAIAAALATASCTCGIPLEEAPTLTGLALSAGVLGPAFAPRTTSYAVPLGLFVQSVTVTPTAASGTITVDGSPVASGTASAPITLALGANPITVVVSGPSGGTTYTVTATRGGNIDYLKASNTGAGDAFGGSMALSGDTLAVGASGEASSTTGINSTPDDGAKHSGAVYVFVRNGSTWSQQAYIKASNTGAGDGFGFSVALSGDTLAVGALDEDSSTTGINSTPNDGARFSGAAYVFVRNGSTWSQQAYIKPSTVGMVQFGFSVALSGDTLAVGALGDDESAEDSGAAYVFVRDGFIWSQQAYIKASNPGPVDYFGLSVALSGDTLAVGAPTEDSGTTGVNSTPDEHAMDSGAVYVFARSGTTWSQQAYLKASNTGAGDNFGVSVALSGDTLAVGALAAYVFVRTGTTWSQQAYLKASNTGAGDFFGSSVALSGDTLAVGAYFEDSSTTGVNSSPDESAMNSGAVYVFVRSGTTWSQWAYVKASNTGAGDQFGASVALSGDTLAVGANVEASSTTGINSTPDEGAPKAGAVYVY